MEITGNLIKKMQEQTGEGKNGPWKKCDFIIEVQEKFSKKVCFTAWGDLINTIQSLNEGANIKVSFDVSSREYSNKWYTDLKAWKIELLGANPTRVDMITETAYDPTKDKKDEQDDLPF